MNQMNDNLNETIFQNALITIAIGFFGARGADKWWIGSVIAFHKYILQDNKTFLNAKESLMKPNYFKMQCSLPSFLFT